jgi:hypothetical protein
MAYRRPNRFAVAKDTASIVSPPSETPVHVPQIAVIVVAALALAACRALANQTPASQTSTEVMAGRWILAAPEAPTCGINLSKARCCPKAAVRRISI